jgi:hypothetical protein
VPRQNEQWFLPGPERAMSNFLISCAHSERAAWTKAVQAKFVDAQRNGENVAKNYRATSVASVSGLKKSTLLPGVPPVFKRLQIQVCAPSKFGTGAASVTAKFYPNFVVFIRENRDNVI